MMGEIEGGRREKIMALRVAEDLRAAEKKEKRECSFHLAGIEDLHKGRRTTAAEHGLLLCINYYHG